MTLALLNAGFAVLALDEVIQRPVFQVDLVDLKPLAGRQQEKDRQG